MPIAGLNTSCGFPSLIPTKFNEVETLNCYHLTCEGIGV